MVVVPHDADGGAEAQAVVLAPTYELAMQITAEARDLSQKAGLGIRVQGIIGGANIARQTDKLKEKPQLVVGSAGRILELARKGKLKLTGVRFLVLDEFDRLLDDQNDMTKSIDMTIFTVSVARAKRANMEKSISCAIARVLGSIRLLLLIGPLFGSVTPDSSKVAGGMPTQVCGWQGSAGG